jgi:hypothetical protein
MKAALNNNNNNNHHQSGVASPRFPSTAELLERGIPFSLDQVVPNVPQIYVMYGLQRRAGRVGSAQGNNQFRRHAGPHGWFERMREGRDVAISRIGGSNFCADAHRQGAAGFIYVILEQGHHLADKATRRCHEQQWMDALRDDTDIEDYSYEAPCRRETCPFGVAHPAPRRYFRRSAL